jgi:hypothetical protein
LASNVKPKLLFEELDLLITDEEARAILAGDLHVGAMAVTEGRLSYEDLRGIARAIVPNMLSADLALDRAMDWAQNGGHLANLMKEAGIDLDGDRDPDGTEGVERVWGVGLGSVVGDPDHEGRGSLEGTGSP